MLHAGAGVCMSLHVGSRGQLRVSFLRNFSLFLEIGSHTGIWASIIRIELDSEPIRIHLSLSP